MLIVMQHGATAEQVEHVVETIQDMGYGARPMPGAQRTAIGLVGNDGRVDESRLAALTGVKEIIHVTQPYKQVSREWQQEDTVVRLPGGLTTEEIARAYLTSQPAIAQRIARAKRTLARPGRPA